MITLNSIILFLKGLIIGIGRIIPGVSGSVIAISLNVYEKAIDAISNFFKKPFINLKFLIPLALGVIASIIYFSKIIAYSLDNFYLYTMLLFIGLIIGGIPSLFKKINKDFNIKNVVIFLITFLLVMALVFITKDNSNSSYDNFYTLIIIGVIDAATMVIPGISGTAVLMLLGYYEATLNFFASLGDFHLLIANIEFVIYYGLGIIIGGILFIKLMEYLLKKKTIPTYFAINAFAISSIIMMIVKVMKNTYPTSEWMIGLLLFVFGIIVTKLMDRK